MIGLRMMLLAVYRLNRAAAQITLRSSAAGCAAASLTKNYSFDSNTRHEMTGYSGRILVLLAPWRINQA